MQVEGEGIVSLAFEINHSAGDHCLLTGKPGRLLRKRSAADLVNSYRDFVGLELPASLVQKYFHHEIGEYQSDESGLRWYYPAFLGESDFYEYLSENIEWYYTAGAWDKGLALSMLTDRKCTNIIEPGCGDGAFLRMAGECGIDGVGVEINVNALMSCREAGVKAYAPDELPRTTIEFGALVSLQSLEHIRDPLGWMSKLVSQFLARYLVIAVPCFEALAGYMPDPLSWPPHHATSWSQRSLATLGSLLGYRLVEVHYQPLPRSYLYRALTGEKGMRAEGLPHLPRGIVGKAAVGALAMTRLHWAHRSNSILGVLERN